MRLPILLCLSAALLAPNPALAGDDYAIRDGAGLARTKAAREIGGKLFDRHIATDHLGNDVDPASAGNQQAEITALTSAVTKLTALLTALGSPAQAPAAASSVALTGTVTSSAATPGSGTCTFASGTAVCGPFAPQLGLPIRLVLKGGATLAASVGTTTGTDCSSVNQLTAGGLPVSFSASVDEWVDTPPTTGGVKYCLTLKVTSGTETYGVRQ